jgi:hypothetical protein
MVAAFADEFAERELPNKVEIEETVEGSASARELVAAVGLETFACGAVGERQEKRADGCIVVAGEDAVVGGRGLPAGSRAASLGSLWSVSVSRLPSGSRTR